jgi:hypothetical protein
LFSSVNVQCCYNEFVILRREFENEFHRNRKNSIPKTIETTNSNELKTTIEQLESTRIDNEEKIPNEENDIDQLPDYSVYNDDVNASILRVLRNEEGGEEETVNQEVSDRVFWWNFARDFV